MSLNVVSFASHSAASFLSVSAKRVLAESFCCVRSFCHCLRLQTRSKYCAVCADLSLICLHFVLEITVCLFALPYVCVLAAPMNCEAKSSVRHTHIQIHYIKMCVFFYSILTSWQFSLCNFISCLAKWSELNRIRRRQHQPNPFDYATLYRLATHTHIDTNRQTDRLPFVCPFNGGVALSTFRRWKMGKNRNYSIDEPSFIVLCLVFFFFLTFCSCFLAAFLSPPPLAHSLFMFVL